MSQKVESIHFLLKNWIYITLSIVKFPVDSTLELPFLLYYLDELVHLPMS